MALTSACDTSPGSIRSGSITPVADGSTLHVNPANVNYLHDEAPELPAPPPES